MRYEGETEVFSKVESIYGRRKHLREIREKEIKQVERRKVKGKERKIKIELNPEVEDFV